MSLEIKFGNLEGKDFKQWQIDDLVAMVNWFQTGFCPPHSREVSVENVEIWYDAEEDYHRLKFESGGKTFTVHSYKVYGYKVDGKMCWNGCPRYQRSEFINAMRDRVLPCVG